MFAGLEAAAGGKWPDSPLAKIWHVGAQAQVAPCSTHFCKTSCFHFLFSLEASITCNSLQLIYIKTIKYDLRYKLTNTRPHIT